MKDNPNTGARTLARLASSYEFSLVKSEKNLGSGKEVSARRGKKIL
jgi:hypothetical protein